MRKALIPYYEVEDDLLAETFYATVNGRRISKKRHQCAEDAIEEAQEWIENRL